MTNQEAMKLALEEMKIGNYNSAAERLETALAKQEQSEPVAWMQKETGVITKEISFDKDLFEPLYTTQQQQRKPLNKKQRIAIIESLEFENSQQELIDAVEAAHGIKE